MSCSVPLSSFFSKYVSYACTLHRRVPRRTQAGRNEYRWSSTFPQVFIVFAHGKWQQTRPRESYRGFVTRGINTETIDDTERHRETSVRDTRVKRIKELYAVRYSYNLRQLSFIHFAKKSFESLKMRCLVSTRFPTRIINWSFLTILAALRNLTSQRVG